MAQFEILASLILLLLGWFFVPFYLRSGVYTMPEFLERRYSPAARWYLAVISIVGYVLTKISVTIFAGGIVFEALMGIDFWTGAFIVVVATGILLGAPILGVWYWCTDQSIVQRVLSARNIQEARRGAIFAGFLKLLPLFIFVVPGIIAYVLAGRGEITLSSPDAALPTLVSALLPEGVRGLVVAGLLAALMSSLSSVFNSCSTLVTWDVYRKLKPQAPERELVVVGQVVTLVMVGFGLTWIPMMQLISG